MMNLVGCFIAPGFGQTQLFLQPPALLNSTRDACTQLESNAKVQKGQGIIFSLIFQRKVGHV